MNDWLAGLLIIGSWVLLAIGFAYGKDAAKLAWTAMRKQRNASPGYATLNAWPSTILPCQSWLGREIEEATLPQYVREAEKVAAQRWAILEMSPIAEEGSDE